MPAWQFAKAQHTAQLSGAPPFVSMQNRYNLVNREEEREMIPLCLDQGVGILPYSPLARGLLVGKRGEERTTARAVEDRRSYRPCDLEIADAVQAIATERATTTAQVALAWLLAQPGVVAPIVGATRSSHIDDALAGTAIQLTDDEQRRLLTPYAPHPLGEFT
jgi:aryl-alcohol dehydrogenase-like predicted oxidoreductase